MKPIKRLGWDRPRHKSVRMHPEFFMNDMVLQKMQRRKKFVSVEYGRTVPYGRSYEFSVHLQLQNIPNVKTHFERKLQEW